MTLIDLTVTTALWLWGVKYTWLFCSLITFLITTKIARTVFNQDLKELNGKDWIYCILLTIFFPIGFLYSVWILMIHWGIINNLRKLHFLTMSLTEVKKSLFKNVRFMRKIK